MTINIIMTGYEAIFSSPRQRERIKFGNILAKIKLNNRQVYSFSLILALVILLLDLSLPLGVAGGVPYIAVILISLWAPQNRCSLYLAVICSVLVAIGFFYSPAGGEWWKVVANRGLALFAIWVTTILIMIWKETRESNIELKLAKELEKEEIYIATIHGTQHIINNLLNQLLFFKMEAENHKALKPETIKILDDLTAEALALTKALSEVDEIDDEKIRQSVHPNRTSKPEKE